MEEKKVPYIKCPHCGHEYTADEIFVGTELIGVSKNVIKDPLGKILYVEYADQEDEPCLVEHYICDGCGRDFVIEADLTFKTHEQEEEKDFTKLETSLF